MDCNQIVTESIAMDLPASIDETGILFHKAVLLSELERIASRAIEANIRFIPLKGAAMALFGHDQSRIRPMTDIDILIQESSFSRWQELCLTEGYLPLPYSKTSYVKETVASVVFDIHTSLRFISSTLNEQLWSQTIKTNYNGTTFELLPPEINIIYLSLHMAITHGYASDKWINDIESIITHYLKTIRWKQVVNYAISCNAAAPVYSVLKKLNERQFDLLPENIFSELKQSSSRWKIKLFASTLDRKHGLPLFDYVAPLLLSSSIFSAIATVHGKLFPPLADMKKRYNTNTLQGATIYYPVRICSLFFKAFIASISAVCDIVKHRVL